MNASPSPRFLRGTSPPDVTPTTWTLPEPSTFTSVARSTMSVPNWRVHPAAGADAATDGSASARPGVPGAALTDAAGRRIRRAAIRRGFRMGGQHLIRSPEVHTSIA
jgi:hypothetical protein